MNKRIAIPVENGLLCAHFGHCEQFYFADIQGGQIIKEETIIPPEHLPGVYPAWVKQQGAHVVITGGIGAKAKDLFAAEQISIYSGAGIEEPQKLAEAFIKGQLSIFEGSCNHDHSDHNCSHG